MVGEGLPLCSPQTKFLTALLGGGGSPPPRLLPAPSAVNHGHTPLDFKLRSATPRVIYFAK